MNTKFALAAVLAASAGLAQAESDLSLARSYELTDAASEYESLLSSNNAANVTVGGQVQVRYQVNLRDDDGLGDDDTTLGFSIRRSKVWVKGDVTDNISAKVQLAFDRDGGDAILEDAYADWEISEDLTLRIGQFKTQLIREENVSSSRQLASDRSVVNESLNMDRSQGIEAHFGGDSWRGAVGFTDGLDTANTTFSSSAEADWALNARFEFLFGDAEWSQFKQFTSWRGSNAGGLLGAAIAWQTMGDTNPSDPAGSSDTLTGTVDFSWVADGWNFYAAGIWQNMDTPTADMDTFGIVAQGGVFVTDQDELFGRYNIFMPDSDNAPLDEDYSAITIGWNHYLVPESHAAKFTLDLTWNLDDTAGSTGLSTSDGINLLDSSEEDQIAITGQFQFLF